MKFWNLIPLAVLSAMTVSGAVNAADYLPVNISGTDVTVTAENPGGERIISMITKKDAGLNDSELFGIYETDGDVLRFVMPDFRDDVDGEYSLYVGGELFGNFCYASEESRENTTKALKSAGADYSSIFDENGEYFYPLVVMGYDIEGYGNADDKERIVELYRESGDYSSGSFNKAVAAVLLDEGADVSDVLSSVNPVFEKESYRDADSALRKWIDSYINKKEFDSIEEFDEEYKLANILWLIDNAKFSELKDLFDKYEKELGLSGDKDYKEYKGLSRANRDKVNDYIVEKFSKSDCTSAEILKDAISDGLETVEEKKSSSGGGGGGGGTGGGKSSNFFFPDETEEKKEDTVLPDNKEEKIQFDDLDKTPWAKDAILALAEKGIVSGDGSGNFNPDGNVTREQFVKMLVLASGININRADKTFSDVDGSAWYADYVLSAYKDGVVMGVDDTVFGIGSLIKRQDMAVMAYRALKGKELADVRELQIFSDGESISDYARDAVNKLYTAGVVSGMGDGMFNPVGTATRAESAVIIYNLFVK